MMQPKKKKHRNHNARWHKVNALLRPLMPASRLKALLWERHRKKISTAGIFNWRQNGVSEACAPAVADLLGVSVEVVLRESGKI